MQSEEERPELRVVFHVGRSPRALKMWVVMPSTDDTEYRPVTILKDPTPTQIVGALAGLREFSRHNAPFPKLTIAFDGIIPEYSTEGGDAYDKALKAARRLAAMRIKSPKGRKAKGDA